MLRTCIVNIIIMIFTLSVLNGELINGPMIAHLEMREAKIWLQSTSPSIARVAYTAKGDDSPPTWSDPIQTDGNNGHTAIVTLDKIEPDQSYSYRVEINGEIVSTLATFHSPSNYKERAPAPDFKIAVGGAHYMIEDGYEPPYRILGGGYDIFTSIAQAEPALMIWAGNTAHLRSSDWGSKSGYQKRFSIARSTLQLQPLLRKIPHYAVWSNHDYGAPNSGQSNAFRGVAEANFKNFWPRPVEIIQLEGVATQFRYADVDFFMLDVRSYRNDTPNGSTRVQILGKEQIHWLRQALIQSTASFKVIIAGAPILNPADSRDNLSYAEDEHTELLQMLRNERISGLFFISGGKKYGELTKLVHANSYNLYDLTVGPLTATPANNEQELNYFRQPSTSSFERHFALIEFSGEDETRTLTVRVMSLEGRELWSRRIPASSLQALD